MRFRPIALCVLVAAVSASGAIPSAAAPGVEWVDPAGDATALPGMESSPRPSDPELDILKVSFATGDVNLSASMRFERINYAPGSEGSAYRFYFSFKEQRYYFEALMGSTEYVTVFGAEPGFYREGTGDSADEKLQCRCTNDFDFKGGRVTFKVSKVDVARALRMSDFGFELTALEGRALRTTVEKFEADIARAPEGTTLRV
ncbi:MAG TPA: hypothetical protein VMY88_01920 [Acidimicrobiales bacterium]|nr:hypothetical protein [Acidimicrobiales bacterium]